MALDTAQKRMSTIAPGCPWRGPLVAAAESGFTEGNRRAAAFFFSGLIGAAVVVPELVKLIGLAISTGPRIKTLAIGAGPRLKTVAISTGPRLRDLGIS